MRRSLVLGSEKIASIESKTNSVQNERVIFLIDRLPVDNCAKMRKHVQEEIERGNIGYGVLLPKQCTTEAIKLSSFGGWAIETPKEKVSPFLPAQVTPNSLYDTFSKPQPIDLTNLDENGKPRVLEVFDLNRMEPVIDRNRDALEE